ncbi:MAG: hypothetical protein RIS29_2133, partial [Bacteroidota bacterium]
TGFDSKFLNTLYVDKNLKYHGLIQAFSRTNRILNDSKPYGNILDFRQQQEAVDRAIARFSGESTEVQAKEIWLVDPAPKVIEQFEEAVAQLQEFMSNSDLACEPQEVYNLKGDAARISFVNRFKEVQRLKTQLDQYTDLSVEQKELIEHILPTEQLMEFRSSYMETAKKLKAKQDKEGDKAAPALQELDFEFVLFASAIIDYDYIMGLIAKFTQPSTSKEKMSREQLINMLSSSANLMDERDEIAEYIHTLQEGKGKTEQEIRDGYQQFKAEKFGKEIQAIAQTHALEAEALTAFVNNILSRMIFDGEELTDLLEPLGLNWKKRREKETELMENLVPLLKKLAQGHEIAGLKAYE